MKYERTPPPIKLTYDEKQEILDWTKASYPKQVKNLAELWEDMRDYYLMQGQRGLQLNWPACFRRWIRRAHKGPTRREPEPYPQEPRSHKKAELQLVRNIIEETKDKANGK